MKKTLLFFLTFLSCFVAYAQVHRVKGRVLSATDHQPLPGVNVVIKGTTQGISTDADGEFTLEVRSDDVLIFSFIGYASQEVVVSNQAEINISMVEDITTLDAVTIVSTGYQQLPKERATGSFVQLDQSLINRRVSTDVMSRIEDITSGLVFNRNVEGKANDMSIRGAATIFSNTRPLIVIDNFPYDGDLNTINPNDVESITVLKDAAAASIWGARAGNGVIVITTKQGKAKQPLHATFNSNVTVTEKPDLHYVPQMSSSEFLEIEEMLFSRGYYSNAENSINHAPLTPAVELLIAQRDGVMSAEQVQQELQALQTRDVRNDLEKHLFQKSIKQQYALSVNGGSAANQYFLSAGWDKNLESLVNNQYDRLTLNANNTWLAIKEKLEFSTGIYYAETKTVNDNPGPNALRVTPVQPLYPYARLKDEEGNNLSIVKDYRSTFTQQAMNKGLLDWTYVPLEEINHRDNTSRHIDYRINARLVYKVLSGLRAEVLHQYWRSLLKNSNHQSIATYYTRNLINQYTKDNGNGTFTYPVPMGGILDVYNQSSSSHNFRSQLSYSKEWDNHTVDAIAGYEIKQLDTEGASFRNYGYNDELATAQAVDYVSLFPRYDVSGGFARVPYSERQVSLTDRFVSVFANAGYSFRHRYTFSASARKDQSNLFGVKANQRGVPLWSTGLAWNLSEESFYNFSLLSYLKLRVTYGYNGNINKNVTAFTTARTLPNDPVTGLSYANIINPPNNNLRWERVKIMNAGLDFQLKDQMLGGSIEFYFKRGIDLIGTTPFAPSTGITNFTGNTANTKGHGVDVVLNSLNVNRAVRWSTDVLFSYISEKVSEYKVKEGASRYLINGSGASEVISPLEGKPVFAIYSYRWAGLDPETGDPRSFLNGGASKDYAGIISAATVDSLVFHGPARPRVFGAVRNTVSWKGISLSFNVSYRAGYWFRRNSVRYSNVLSGIVDHGDFSDRWLQPGDEVSTDVPSIPELPDANRDNVYLFSEVLVEKGDHIRLQDVNVSYTFNRATSCKLPFTSAQLYVYANNLGMLWKATRVSIDPDYPTMKPLRSVACGVRINF